MRRRKGGKEEKEEKNKGINLIAIQEDSEEKNFMDSSKDDDEITMLIRGFKKLLRIKNFIR